MIGNKIKTRNNGFTLLYAVVVMSILLLVVFSITSLTLRSLNFSFSGRNSQQAFYASQSAAECALFWDVSQAGFGRDGSAVDEVDCTEGASSPVSVVSNSSSFTYSFSVEFPDTQQCAVVTIEKYKGSSFRTVIEARGYNTCDVNDERRVERGFRAVYKAS